MMTLPGTPVIYYGTEVGLSQRYDGVVENAEARLPMLWGATQNQDLLAHFQQLGRTRGEIARPAPGDRKTVLADRGGLRLRTQGRRRERDGGAQLQSEQAQRPRVAAKRSRLDAAGSAVSRTGTPQPAN